MSLNWSIEKCADRDAITAEGLEWAKTESLIFFTMAAGLPSTITEDSAADWYARISTYEALNGAFCYSEVVDGEPVWSPFTPADIASRVGLSTNGHYGRKEAWSTWLKRVTQYREVEASAAYRRATAEAVAS